MLYYIKNKFVPHKTITEIKNVAKVFKKNNFPSFVPNTIQYNGTIK